LERKLGLIITCLLMLSFSLVIALPVVYVQAAAPTVISVDPTYGVQGQTLPNVVITGTDFINDSHLSLSFGDDITVTSLHFDSASQITGNITIDADATPGTRDVTVTTLEGPGTLHDGFTIKQAPPIVNSLSSNSGFRGQPPIYVSIYGHYFGKVLEDGTFISEVTAVSFGPGITVHSFGAFNDTWLLTRISIAIDATPGKRTITVTTPGGTGTLHDGFTISEAAVSIKVTSPNGGERWEMTTNQTITWTSSGLTGTSGRVSIQLSRDGGETWKTLMVSTPNNGIQAWKVTGPATNQARIKVLSTIYPDIFDISDANFIIPAPTIRVTSPNGGESHDRGESRDKVESWQIGTKQTITWTSSPGVTGRIKIELSRDGGETWKTLISSTANDGIQSWKVTGPATNLARIKVTSLANPDVYDISDANFILSTGTIRVISPNGGESWKIGTKQTITWTSLPNVGSKIKIQLSRDGGSTWKTIISSTPNDGFQAWKVNQPITNQARIMVLSNSYPDVFDINDANFTITR